MSGNQFKGVAAGASEPELLQFIAYLFAQSTTLGKAQTGVFAGLGVTPTGTASGSVTAAAGMAIVQQSRTTGATPLICNTDTPIDILGPSPMGAVPRWDLVIFNADTAKVEVKIGDANASPADPTVPANSIKLARIRQIVSGQPNYGTIPASIIDDLRVPTTLNVPPVGTPARVSFSIQSDQGTAAGIAGFPVVDPTWVIAADGNTVRGAGAFTYTTGQGAVTQRTISSACIPVSARAKTDRGILQFITVGNLGSWYGPIRHDINPKTGAWIMYRADLGSFSWAGNDQRISLTGIGWDLS